ncbi:MAG: hypothetical protein HUU35_19865, partial [Armatimonadetes bacterium]|nr:hypothetical protein [Armatimonadota bacterium]
LATPAPDPTRHDVALVCEPPLADCAPALRKFAEGGGTLVLSHVAAGSGDLAAVGLPGVALSAYPGEVTRNEQLPAPFDLALLREDLYWLAPQTAVLSWTTRSRLPGQAVAAISPRVDEATAVQYPATAMEVSGSYAGKEADRVYLASSGTIRGVIKAPMAGRYVLGVRGWGTPCSGIYPILAVSVGRLRVGSVALGAEPASHGVEVQLSAGEQSIELEFINDENAGGEDRNAHVAGVSVAPTSATDGYQVLTSPAAVITREVGRGRVILDNLRWEQAPGNELKAQRYLAGLLTAAGAAAAMRGGGAVVQGELMRIQPGLEWVKATDDHLAMVQASWAEADIEVRTAGAYRLTITARATPARDEWPHVVVSLDGQPLGEVQVVARAWRDFVVPVSLPAGRHLLRVTYDNDLQDVENREDRNLFLDRVTLTPAGEETDR